MNTLFVKQRALNVANASEGSRLIQIFLGILSIYIPVWNSIQGLLIDLYLMLFVIPQSVKL